jgi:hypothetical protein
MPAAHHEPRQSAQKLLRPRSRRPAHAHQLPRPDEPTLLGDEAPHLGEGGGALDGLVGFFLERGGDGERHYCVLRGMWELGDKCRCFFDKKSRRK